MFSSFSAIKKSFSELVSAVKTMELEKWEYFEQFNDNTAYTLSFTKCLDASGVLFGRYNAPAFDAIKALTSEIHKMFNDGNLDGIPATYTENAVIYMNEENPIIGRRGE
ncbi:hypothetical protein LSH36_604g04061 [Paralvinella palmiformis]|uniref:Uncharacterized protein n=1 Tax=Paralvinella palmiformis TaxID=53620 RepID=A0AAD9J4Z7_9ANNE|nr:hypothetical protein LSH36_604g04061 [Paralvinella palmiformis]